MKHRLLGAASLVVLAPIAAAQPISIDQINPPSRHVSDVEQVPASRTERRGAALALSGAVDPSEQAGLSPRGASRSSVDAEEIARLLSTGRASSIDAAAALATGAIEAGAAGASAPEEEPKADDRAAASEAVSLPREQR